MPELPEVETIRQKLAPHIIDRKFSGIKLLWPKTVQHPTPEQFCRQLIAQTVVSTGRRGKYMLLRLSAGDTLIIHLKMTGILLLDPVEESLKKYTTAILNLNDGINLHFIDQRKFGSLWLVADESAVIGKLGPEPLEDSFTTDVLKGKLKNRQIPIKALLCDQHAIAGVGNMYADEALFVARIHPEKPANRLSDSETERLTGAIKAVLRKGIQNGGASIQNYLHPGGDKGNAHAEFQVAHRFRQPCFNCGSMLERIKIRGRGTYFCPSCQPRVAPGQLEAGHNRPTG